MKLLGSLSVCGPGLGGVATAAHGLAVYTHCELIFLVLPFFSNS